MGRHLGRLGVQALQEYLQAQAAAAGTLRQRARQRLTHTAAPKGRWASRGERAHQAAQRDDVGRRAVMCRE
eukprot:548127-Prymnesium_polylepis.1